MQTDESPRFRTRRLPSEERQSKSLEAFLNAFPEFSETSMHKLPIEPPEVKIVFQAFFFNPKEMHESEVPVVSDFLRNNSQTMGKGKDKHVVCVEPAWQKNVVRNFGKLQIRTKSFRALQRLLLGKGLKRSAWPPLGD